MTFCICLGFPVSLQVAADEAAADQQLLSAGVNDRNVGDFLGLIEQRIDDLIQVRFSHRVATAFPCYTAYCSLSVRVF